MAICWVLRNRTTSVTLPFLQSHLVFLQGHFEESILLLLAELRVKLSSDLFSLRCQPFVQHFWVTRTHPFCHLRFDFCLVRRPPEILGSLTAGLLHAMTCEFVKEDTIGTVGTRVLWIHGVVFHVFIGHAPLDLLNANRGN